MFYRKSIPPLPEFTKVLSFIVNLKEYDSAIYLIKKFDFLGVKPDVIPSVYVFNIAINCGIKLFRKMEMANCPPGIIQYSTVIDIDMEL